MLPGPRTLAGFFLRPMRTIRASDPPGIDLAGPSGDHSHPASAAPTAKDADVMQVRINGESRHLERSLALPELLDMLDLAGKRVAVEHNGVIVPRSRHAETQVSDGDELLIVQAIGGG